SLPIERCRPRPELFLANSLLPLSAAGVWRLEEPSVQVALGRRIGSAAAAAASERSSNATLREGAARLTVETGGRDVTGAFRFAESFVRSSNGSSEPHLNLDAFPLLGECDVLVAGGGTGGAPAGIAAARAGAKTV